VSNGGVVVVVAGPGGRKIAFRGSSGGIGVGCGEGHAEER
jgi:hypothetical protein